MALPCARAQAEPFHQVDDAILFRTDRRIALARLRVENGHVVTGHDDNDALIALAVGPVGKAATGELTWRFLPANTLVVFP